MDEIVKYFQNIEARLVALETAEQAETEQEQRIAALKAGLDEAKALLAALSAKNIQMQAEIAKLQAEVIELAARPVAVAAPVAAAAAAPAAAPAKPSLNESEVIATDEETGLPEMEVEFVDEPEPAAPAAAEPKPEDPFLTANPVFETVKQEPAPAAAPAAPVTAPAPAAEAPKAPVAEPVTTIGEAAVKEVKTSVVPKLDDLKKGITMGDRFLFQRELFGNNGELMQKTIATLNAMGSLAEAEDYIAKNFQWNKESNAYELFTDLLKRRW